jgi:hypothetical protein
MFEDFPSKQRAGGKKLTGKDFLTEAKAAHERLFADFIREAEEGAFDDFKSFYAKLQQASWALMEDRCKQSFSNGKRFRG